MFNVLCGDKKKNHAIPIWNYSMIYTTLIGTYFHVSIYILNFFLIVTNIMKHIH